MAKLGFRTVNEMIGQTDKIIPIKLYDHWKIRGINLNKPLFKPTPLYQTGLYRTKSQNHELENLLDHELIKEAKPALENKEKVVITKRIKNTNRTVGTMLSSEVVKKYGEDGLPHGTIKINLRGTAGQSFGAFLAKGIELHLTGEANDYFGKGLSGGKVSVKIPPEVTFEADKNIIVGNTCLYGATSGEAFINGVAGERFAVRNSGANAVVEGIGDHGCEYMTGGRVVVLGKIGRNFAAGMSGGIAYIWDPTSTFSKNVNLEMVELERLTESEEIDSVLHLLTLHREYTGSKRANDILENWNIEVGRFIKVMPTDYKKALLKMKEEEQSQKQGVAVNG